MSRDPAPTVHVGKVWRLMLFDLGLNPQVILRRAGLPAGGLEGEGTRIPLDHFYALWNVVTEETNDPGLALKLGQVTSIEFFDPAFFAAMCSPDMNTAARRLGEFKRLVGAFSLDVEVTKDATTIGFRCKYRPDVPLILGLTELVFLVAFARRATRHPITPIQVAVPSELTGVDDYVAWFGCPISVGAQPSLRLTPTDARRPFLTHDEQLWKSFEPSLRRRMEDAEGDMTTRARVERALFELLPSGRTQIEDVARELALSKRSLQRRLAEEDTTCWRYSMARVSDWRVTISRRPS